MKIFISGTAGFGSFAIKVLPYKVQEYLLDVMKQGADFLVGDCFGVDYPVQEFLNEHHYNKVTVYVSGDKVRNCVGDWDIVHIPVPSNVTGRDFYAQKDKAMQKDCDIAVAVWDGKSKGTGSNIENVRAMGKLVFVWDTVHNKWL